MVYILWLNMMQCTVYSIVIIQHMCTVCYTLEVNHGFKSGGSLWIMINPCYDVKRGSS